MGQGIWPSLEVHHKRQGHASNTASTGPNCHSAHSGRSPPSGQMEECGCGTDPLSHHGPSHPAGMPQVRGTATVVVPQAPYSIGVIPKLSCHLEGVIRVQLSPLSIAAAVSSHLQSYWQNATTQLRDITRQNGHPNVRIKGFLRAGGNACTALFNMAFSSTPQNVSLFCTISQFIPKQE